MSGRIGKIFARVNQHIEIARHRRQGRKVVHLLHIGKTGGSAVKVALEGHLVTPKYLITLNPHHTTLRDIRVGDSVIFFLRDPISRFVSGFYSRQRKGQPRSYSEWTADEKAAFETFSTPNELALALSSSDGDRRSRAVRAMETIRHVRDSYYKWFESDGYFRSRANDIFFVGHQESLNADFETLKQKLGVPVEAVLPTDPVRAHKNPDKLDNKLDDVAVQNLRKWFQAEWKFIDLCRECVGQGHASKAKAA